MACADFDFVSAYACFAFLVLVILVIISFVIAFLFRGAMSREYKVDFLELCNDRLLIKQKHHALQVLNVFDGHVSTVPVSVFKSPEVHPPSPPPSHSTLTKI